MSFVPVGRIIHPQIIRLRARTFSIVGGFGGGRRRGLVGTRVVGGVNKSSSPFSRRHSHAQAETVRVVRSSKPTTLKPSDYHRETEVAISPWRKKLLAHPVYAAVQNAADLRAFMSVHVFAVWDFMSLVKALQSRFAPVTIPWVPPKSRLAARIINGIVLGEETDSFEELKQLTGHQHMSHAELYLRAMTDLGADTQPFARLVGNIEQGKDLFTGLEVDPIVEGFVRQTLGYCRQEVGAHVLASAFLYGREDPIPDMFRRVLDALPDNDSSTQLLRVYMLRHIHVDEGEHGPQAQQLLEELCGVDSAKWEAVALTAVEAIQARMRLWDAAFRSINVSKSKRA